MLPLLDTVTGFAAIMLVLSLLVKSLTSLIKNHVDFYSRNLKHEVNRLVLGVLGKTWDKAVADLSNKEDKSWFEGINWERHPQRWTNWRTDSRCTRRTSAMPSARG